MVWGDLRDQALLERTLGEYEVNTVMHLGAQAIVGVANRNAVSTFESNVAGTWCLLEACHRSPKVQQIVMASSDKAYGAQPTLPYTEEMPLEAWHPYDASKACSEIVARSYARTFDLPLAITRCGNFYGPGDLNWNRVVPGTIRSALRGERPVIRSDGQFVRDYLYIEDGVAAYMLLAERLAADPRLAGEAFNFSLEQPLTVYEMVRTILLRMRCDLSPLVLNHASHEIRLQYLSAAKARDWLGWRPRYSLDEGLDRTISWYSSFWKQHTWKMSPPPAASAAKSA
jgi:CDP-glucose 4,6-dehydratase